MLDFSETIESERRCDICGGALVSNLDRRAETFVQTDESFVYLFCSKACFRAGVREQSRQRWLARRRFVKTLVVGIILAGAWLTPHEGPAHDGPPHVVHAPRVSAPVRSSSTPLPVGWFGPEWPPTDASLLAALGRDAWIHPLAGPVRRMPRADSRVFGADRPGNRAVECRNGHCGVDLGGEVWGEHVRAVHDGVVDYVQRGPNPDHGGRFVRISHREGTVITQYFHLAAIPRGIERGVLVKGGQVIGLLGDSGVKESAPHLHFSISIRPTKDGPEKYMDPEPLIALWPLHVPVEGGEVGLVTTVARAGVPLGSMPLRAGHKRSLAKQKRPPSSDRSDRGRSEDGDAAPADEEPSESVDPSPSPTPSMED